MGSELIPLGDLCSKVLTGGTPLTKNKHFYEGGDIPWLKTKEVNFNFIQETENFITQEGLDGSSAKLVPINSVIVAMYGQGDTAGRVAINKVPVTTNQACCNLVIDPKKADFRYVYYYLKHSYAELVRRKTGSAQPNLNTRILKEFEILNLPLEEQTSIGKLLEKFDLKIILNSKINQTLEQMAQTLFKSWFVDFDPVIDNALDAGSDIPDVFETRVERRKAVRESADFKPLPDDVRQLFPSEFEESEFGWGPKGWGSETFNDIFDIASSKRVFAKDYVDSGVPFYRGKEITELSQGKAVNTEIFISEEKYQELKDKSGAPKAGDILITSVGTIGNTYLVREGDKFYFKDGNLTWIRGYKKERIPFFIKEWFKTSQAKDAIERVKIGTTQQAITIKALNKIVVLLPSTKILSFYENYLSNTYSKHSANLDENAYLEKLRDTLLPKLISGELRLDSPEVEQAKALVE